MTEEAVLGNEAIARGLVESGVNVVTSYPGTPSSEILAAVVDWKKKLELDTYVEWSVNEKAAFEVALAASWTGKRAAVAMKQVGLNVASDPLLSAAYTGVVGGFVAIVCDDPGPYSSQTEQDTRLFAIFAKVPVLDPSTPREAKDLVETAFALSEKFRMPVILRSALRVSHARQNITFNAIDKTVRPAHFVRDAARWAATPHNRLMLHHELNRKLIDIEKEFETSGLNRRFQIEDPTMHDGQIPLGLITGGVPHETACDLLGDLGVEIPILKIVTTYPLPRRLVANFIACCKKVLVLEEPDAGIELQIPHKENVLGRLDGTVPNAGELSPDVLYAVLTRVLSDVGVLSSTSWKKTDTTWEKLFNSLELPIRPPRLCPGCPHRSTFYSIRAVFPDALYPSDIGCYTLGTNLHAVDTCLDMGAAVTVAAGIYHAYRLDEVNQPIVATIGDSTFIHSGVTGLANAVHTRARFILVILDNATTAMTGFQPTAAQTRLADGSDGVPVEISQLVRACGVGFLREADPYCQEDFRAVLKEAGAFTQSEKGGIAVVIAKHACVLQASSRLHSHSTKVEIADQCDGCRHCLIAFECPALVENRTANRIEIDRRACVDCGQCVYACHRGFIVQSKTGEQSPIRDNI